MPYLRFYALLIGMIFLGLGLRLYQLDAVAFRGDEAYTVQNWALRPLDQTLQSETITRDPHPPLSYALYRYWYLAFGVSEFSLRLLPTLFNLIGIASSFALGKRLGGLRVGLIGALLWAVHPFEIWHSQDARNYAIWAALSITALYFGKRASEKSTWGAWALYLLTAGLAAYIYYLEVFMLVAFNAYILLTAWRKRDVLFKWFVSQLALALILAPWYLQPSIRSGGGYTGTTFTFEPLRLITWFLPTLTFGETLPYADLLGWLLVFILSLSLLLYWRKTWQNALFLLLIIFIPMLCLAIVSSRLNVFTPRYVLGTAPAYLLLFVLLIDYVWQKFGRSAALLLLSLWLGVSAYSLANYYFIYPPKAPDWRGLVAYLAENTNSDDLILQKSVDAGFGLYYDLYTPSASEAALPLSPQQSPAEIDAMLVEINGDYDAIWAVGKTFPDWAGAGAVDTWLGTHRQLTRSVTLAGLPAQAYRAWEVSLGEYQPERLVSFQNTANLMGKQIFLEPNRSLAVWLYWQPVEQTETSLKVFVHLIGAINPSTNTPLWSQADQFPQSGQTLTTAWSNGTVYRDVFFVPLEGVPAGNYDLWTGFYNAETGERILIETGQDAYWIGSITID